MNADTYRQGRDPLVTQSGVFKSQNFFLQRRAEIYAHAVLAAVHVVDGPDAAALVDRRHLAFAVAAPSFGVTDGCLLIPPHRAPVLVFCYEVAVPLHQPRRCIVALASNRGG